MTGRPQKVLFTWDPGDYVEIVERDAPGICISVATEREDMLRLVPDADVLCIGDFDAELLAAARRLQWVQALMGGVESVLFPELIESPIPLACCKECFSIPAAEHALAMMLAFSRRLEYDIRRRAHRTFEYRDPEELYGKTAVVIGMGNIGREVARRCRSFGMRVIGTARQARSGAPLYLDELLPHAELPTVLGRADFVIVCVPLTAQTEGLIGAPEVGRMKPSAYLIDVSGRPTIYDLDAVQTALRQGSIAGAALQIVPPDDSSLWDIDNLLISLHRSTSRQEVDRCLELFADNLNRFRCGEPLRGLVDKAAGY